MYEWLKALHIIAVIAWMVGMLYLPRLLVYHTAAPVGSPQSETFKLMEWRLARMIVAPAITLAWIIGLWLAYESGYYKSGWFHAKFALALLMSALHGYLVGQVKKFGRDERPHSARFYRILNEVPTVLLIAIVILVVVKPF